MNMNGTQPRMISFLLILFQLFYFPLCQAYIIKFLKILHLTLAKVAQIAGRDVTIGNFQNCVSQR